MTRYSSVAVNAMAFMSLSSTAMAFRFPTFEEIIKPGPFLHAEKQKQVAYETCQAEAFFCSEPPPHPYMLPFSTSFSLVEDDSAFSLLLSPPSPCMQGSPFILEEIFVLSAPMEEEEERDPIDVLVDDILDEVLSVAMMPSPPAAFASTTYGAAPQDDFLPAQAAEELFDALIGSFVSHAVAAQEAVASADPQDTHEDSLKDFLYDPIALTQKIHQKGQDILRQSSDTESSSDSTAETYDLEHRLARRLTELEPTNNNHHHRRRLQMMEDEQNNNMEAIPSLLLFSMSPYMKLLSSSQPSSSSSSQQLSKPLPQIGYGSSIDSCLWKQYSASSSSSPCTTEMTKLKETFKEIALLSKDLRFYLEALNISFVFLILITVLFALFRPSFFFNCSSCSTNDDENEEEEEDEEEEVECNNALACLFNVVLVVLVLFPTCILFTINPKIILFVIPHTLIFTGLYLCLELFACTGGGGSGGEEEKEEVDEMGYVLVMDEDEEEKKDAETMTTRTDASECESEVYEGVPVSVPVLQVV